MRSFASARAQGVLRILACVIWAACVATTPGQFGDSDLFIVPHGQPVLVLRDGFIPELRESFAQFNPDDLLLTTSGHIAALRRSNGDSFAVGGNVALVFDNTSGATPVLDACCNARINARTREALQGLGSSVLRGNASILYSEQSSPDEAIRWMLRDVHTRYAVAGWQKIAYVNGNDLWIMNDDGSGRTNFIAAPPGKRIGRSAFSPDGSHVAYEVWDTGADRFPETSDLWIANGDGSSPQLLVSAGLLSEDTGRSPYEFACRLLWGPSFSPNSQTVSFLRWQVYARPGVEPGEYRHCMLDEEVMTVPASGGTAQSLWRTSRSLGAQLPSAYPLDSGVSPWSQQVGVNTAWDPRDGRILFRRSGGGGLIAVFGCDAQDTEETSWLFELTVGWAHEGGYAPAALECELDGEPIHCLPLLHGFGTYWGYTEQMNWYPFPDTAPEWQTPCGGAWYGKITNELAAGTYDLLIRGSDGLETVTLDTNFTVTSGWSMGRQHWSGFANGWGLARGVWSISPAGGAPSRISPDPATSLSFNHAGSCLAIEASLASPLYITLLDPDGEALGSVAAGAGEENYIGNWNVTGQRIVTCSGSGGAGTIYVVDADSGALEDLGAGEFPVFTPLFRTVVSVARGSVSVTDGDGGNERIAGAGQSIVIDDLEGGGLPQAPAVFAWPSVTNITPSDGGAWPNDTNLTVTCQFSIPIDTNTVANCRFSVVTWPPTPDQPALTWNRYALLLNGTSSPRCVCGTVSGLQSNGLVTVSWNTNLAQVSFTLTPTNFPRTAGDWCDVSLGLTGVTGTNGAVVPFDSAETLFAFADMIGTNGGLAVAQGNASLEVPPAALSSNTPVPVGFGGEAEPAWGPPSTGGWDQASAMFQMGGAGLAFASNATVCLPVERRALPPVVWRFDGASWTNLGGTYDADTGQVCVETESGGWFGAFYQRLPTAALHVAKAAGVATATNGQGVAFSIGVENIGETGATNVMVTDVLPDDLVCLTNSLATNAVYTPGTRTVTWSFSLLQPGSNVQADLACLVSTSTVPGVVITNVASATADGLPVTSGAPVLVRVRSPLPRKPFFGIGSTNSRDWQHFAALSASYRRVSANISTLEARDTNLIDFTTFDAEALTNQALGMRTYGIVNCTSVTGTWPSAAEFATALGLYVERYDADGSGDAPGFTNGVHEWELFDEFEPGAGPWTNFTLEMYADFLAAAHAAAHGRDPDVTVLPSAFSGMTGTNYLQQLLTNYPWARDYIDAVSVHDHWAGNLYWTGSEWAQQYLEARSISNLVAQLGLAGREIWAAGTDFTATYAFYTNLGFYLSDMANAKFVVEAYPFVLGAGFDHVFYSELEHHDEYDPNLQWAVMIDSNSLPRMSYFTFRKVIEKLEGVSPLGVADAGDSNLVARFVAGDQPLWVAWNHAAIVAPFALPIGPVSEVRVTLGWPIAYDSSSATWSVVTNPVVDGMAWFTFSVNPDVPRYIEPVGWIDPDLDADGLANWEDDDTDGDGMPDSYEIANGLNPFADDADDDLDGDGAPNLDECLAGTSAAQSNSLLKVTGVVPRSGGLEVDWTSVSGRTYRVECTEDLASWSDAAVGSLRATNSETLWLDTAPTPPDSPTNRFYRARIVE